MRAHKDQFRLRLRRSNRDCAAELSSNSIERNGAAVRQHAYSFGGAEPPVWRACGPHIGSELTIAKCEENRVAIDQIISFDTGTTFITEALERLFSGPLPRLPILLVLFQQVVISRQL